MQPGQDGQGHERPLVVSGDGVEGRLVATLDDGRALVAWNDGRTLLVSPGLLSSRPDGTFALGVHASTLNAAGGDYTVVPVLREEVDIGKRLVETERGVRIRKQVLERQQEVVQVLYREQLDVQHVPVNQVVDRPPPVRYEGTTMIVPLCEEVLVIEKRLLLKEEVRVTRAERPVRHAETVVLRSEQATVERFGAESPSGAEERPEAPRAARARDAPRRSR